MWTSTKPTVHFSTRYNFLSSPGEDASQCLSCFRDRYHLGIQHHAQCEDNHSNTAEGIADTCREIDLDVATLDRTFYRREPLTPLCWRNNLLARFRGWGGRHSVYEP